MEIRLPELIREKIIDRTRFKEVLLVDDPASVVQGYAIAVTIIGLDVARKGWSTAPEFMKIHATLYRDGKGEAEFIKAETIGMAMNNPIRGFRTSCTIADKLAKELSEELHPG